ncbi:MAG TPA: WYL domain-containing protein [Roseiflexaceae bacterium]|nr:WYL domain-containing protein [Roseiflexaceae bacterium]
MDRIQSKAARLRRIEHRLYNSPEGARVVELAEYCGVDRRTIYRDLMTLHDMGVPVWEHDGRYGIDRQSYLSTVRLNLNEAIALYFAARLLAHHSDEHNPHVVGALDKLAASFPDPTISGHISSAAGVIRSKPMRGTYVRALEVLTRAWADRRKVQISYRATGGRVTERVIGPYFLEVSRSEPAAYVIGFDDLRAAIRTFKIERIISAELLESGYEIPEDFDPYAYLAASWSVMDEAEVEIRLRFTPAVAERVRESVWHHSQRLNDTADGGCELLMRVGGIREIRAWVLGWGADVEVLTPPELRDEVAEHARRMAARYLGQEQAVTG